MRSRRAILLVVLTVVAGAAALLAGFWRVNARSADKSDIEHLARLLHWRAGSVIGEAGAGSGTMSIAAAQIASSNGHVYANEISTKRVRNLEDTVRLKHISNVTVVRGTVSSANLPARCCDSIFLRDVYHHFEQPNAMDASIRESLKPGGLLAVIDFPPQWWLSLIAPVKGVPKNRGGHGIPRDVLTKELEANGFAIEETIPHWRGRMYCVVFRKR